MLAPLVLALAMLGQVANPPNSFTMNDSVYGDVTMTWDNVNAWKGTSSASLPNNPCCSGGANFTLLYTLTKDPTRSDWWLTVGYRTSNFTTFCPDGSAGPPNVLYWTRIEMAGSPPLVTFPVNGTVPGTQAWPAYTGVTLKLNLP